MKTYRVWVLFNSEWKEEDHARGRNRKEVLTAFNGRCGQRHHGTVKVRLLK